MPDQGTFRALNDETREQWNTNAAFWNLPIFHPTPNVTAYSDCYLAVAPAYWLWRALAIFAAAFASWILDITKTACAPDSIVQGHAIWHLLGAASAYCLYLYFKSERLQV